MKPFYVFDAYGTLFDVKAPVRRHAEALGEQSERLAEMWRAKQLEYSWVLSLSGIYRNFESVTEDALDFSLASLGIKNKDLRGKLLSAWMTPDCFNEVKEALSRVKGAGARLAILSNGTPNMLESALTFAQIGHFFNAVLSVDKIERYKTDPECYRLVTRYFDCAPSEVSFQSSNRWDIAGASVFGFHTVWINRSGQPDEYKGFGPDRVIKDLAAL
jgi:2-haloacid dehalogenase